MKDVQACEKRGGAGNGALIPRYPNGETRPFTDGFRRASARQNPTAGNSGVGGERGMCEGSPLTESIGQVGRTRRTETSK